MTLADEDPQSFVDVYADVLTVLHCFNVDVMSILISMVIYIKTEIRKLAKYICHGSFT